MTLPKFTEGQKVRILPGAVFAKDVSFDRYGKAGDLRTVTRATPDGSGDIVISDGVDNEVYISEDSVEAVDTPTEREKTVTTIEEGKRYRYTVDCIARRGTGADVGVYLEQQGHNRLICNGTALANMLAEGSVTVELLPDPLPTTPGSVVMVTRDDLYHAGRRNRIPFKLNQDGLWHGTESQKWTTGNVQSEVGGHLNGEVTVLFDAGAEVQA